MPCLLASALLTLRAETVQSEYNPSSDTSYDITEKVTRATTATGEAPVTDAWERRSRLIVAKPSDTSYANAVTVVSQKIARNGSAIVSPVYAAMAGLTLTYELDSAGRLVDITGYDQLTDAMSAKLADKLASTLLKLLSYDSLEEQGSQQLQRGARRVRRSERRACNESAITR